MALSCALQGQIMNDQRPGFPVLVRYLLIQYRKNEESLLRHRPIGSSGALVDEFF